MRDLLPALMLEQKRLSSARPPGQPGEAGVAVDLSHVAELLETGSLAGRMTSDRTLPHPLVLNDGIR
jgi:hypothetical protein